ncbi:helix-turn-helix transcriptional regulator [Parahaliea sp. F7430]|uniref:Helix-turn-helix transcriptional regulator n=1 Tax=Sediminihaliea albiluteola TaxID=2758564 RepID=A0A7W2YKK1_9GAMM|nr:LuxR family transcriptional regulator [Sediminihaliea albiluteola]MBA6413448.1 helix-turn-helix transcriptional regulator [Sediminihaliea albiluteola]
MPELKDYSQRLALLIESIQTADFSARLIDTLRSLVPIDDATVILYPARGFPLLEYFEEPEELGHSTLDHFIRAAFVLDPFYIAGTEQHFGVFRLQELSPEGFKDSEYYKNWYRNCGYQDECGYILRLSDDAFINIALGKTKPNSHFSDSQVERLRSIAAVIDTLCRKHWELDTDAAPDAIDLRQQLHQALKHFGRSLLTEREAQVINLVLHGHSTKTVADKLSISIETVKLHRKHAYAKLEVSSQAELFYLFLDSLMSAKNYDGGDTLIAYLQPPRH